MKRVLKTVITFVMAMSLICISIFAANNEVLSNKVRNTTLSQYPDFTQNFKIPGIPKMIPQGFTKFTQNNTPYFALSACPENSSGKSKIYIYNISTGQVNTVTLSINSHVGGIHATTENLWVCNKQSVVQIPLASLTDNTLINVDQCKSYRLTHQASYITKYNGIYWIGYFDGNKLYGYKSLNKKGSNKPDYTVNLPKNVQGIAFLGSPNKFVLSQSHGRKNASTLLAYDNVNLTANSKMSLGKPSGQVKAPPMTEEIVYYNGLIYTVFESATNRYYFSPYDEAEKGKCIAPMDYVCTIPSSILFSK